MDLEMKLFPRTYNVVRGGSTQVVTVDSAEALLELRTELELVVQFGEGSTPDDIQTLDEQLRTFSDESGEGLARLDSLADVRGILADSLNPVNRRTAEAIDHDFPEIKEALDMASIRKEKDDFRKDLEQQLGTEQPVRARNSAGGGSAAADSAPEATPAPESRTPEADALAEADCLLNELLPTEEAKTAEAAAASLLNTHEELTDVAASLENAAGDLAELGRMVNTTQADEVLADDAPANASSSDDAAFEAMAAELEAAMSDEANAPKKPTAKGEIDLSAAIAVSAPAETTSSVGNDVAPPSAGFEAVDLRRQLADIKGALVVQLDRLGTLVEQSAGMQDSARRTLEQANRFRAAAQDAQKASQRFAAAQATADQARAAYEEAQRQVAQARQEWEAAQCVASEAAGELAPSGL